MSYNRDRKIIIIIMSTMLRSVTYLIILISLFLTGGCKNNNSEVDYNPNVNSSRDYIYTENNYFEIFNLYFKAINDPQILSGQAIRIDSCEITYNPGDNTMLFNYGRNPQCCNDGKHRVGSYTAVFDGPVNETGTHSIITFDSLFVNKAMINGNITSGYIGNNNQNKPEYTFIVTNGLIILPDTINYLAVSYESDFMLTWEEGNDTPADPSDDMLLVTGSSSGISQDNLSYTLNVTDPLKDYLDCFWIQSGTHSINIPESHSPKGVIDYIVPDGCFYQVNFYFDENLFYTYME